MKLPIPSTERTNPPISFNRPTSAEEYPGLQGSAVPGSAGGTVVDGTIYRECLKVAGHPYAKIRLLTESAAGTLSIKPARMYPVDDPNDQGIYQPDGTVDTSKIYAYATGSVSAPVEAGVEVELEIDLSGEAYVLVEFDCSTAGNIVFCDAFSLRVPPAIRAA